MLHLDPGVKVADDLGVREPSQVSGLWGGTNKGKGVTTLNSFQSSFEVVLDVLHGELNLG